MQYKERKKRATKANPPMIISSKSYSKKKKKIDRTLGHMVKA